MNNEEKALEIAVGTVGKRTRNHPSNIPHIICVKDACIEMAQWKDEQYKTAYVVTRCEEHDDYVEQVFFDKIKAEEYCKPYNEDENSYYRNITKIEVTL